MKLRLILLLAPDLRRLAAERCENFTSGDCAAAGREPFAKYGADRYCWPCQLRYALGVDQ